MTFPTEGPCEKSLFLLKRLARLQNHEDPRASVEKPFANRPTTAQSARRLRNRPRFSSIEGLGHLVTHPGAQLRQTQQEHDGRGKQHRQSNADNIHFTISPATRAGLDTSRLCSAITSR